MLNRLLLRYAMTRNEPVHPATIRLTNALGFDVTVTVDRISEVNNVVRQLARSGWRSGSIPVGGIIMPTRMFPVFDFSLIG